MLKKTIALILATISTFAFAAQENTDKSVTSISTEASQSNFMMSIWTGMGISLESRRVEIGDYTSVPYSGLSQLSWKTGIGASYQSSPLLGYTAGFDFSMEGLNADTGHLKKRSGTIIHEGIILNANIGLQQYLDKIIFQETLFLGRGNENKYIGINRQAGEGRISKSIASHTRWGLNFRVSRIFLDNILIGTELSGQQGKVSIVNVHAPINMAGLLR